MQPDLRLGLVTRAGQQAILRQPDQGPGRFAAASAYKLDAYSCRARPCRQVAIRASDAHATPQTRADSASAWYSHSRAKSRLAARKRGTCQFMKSRSGALAALATRQLPRRFLPLQPREIHPAGIASVPAGDVRAFMRQDGAAGVGRQQLQQRQPEPQHVARAAPEPSMLPDAGIAFAVQVDRVQRRAPTWARTRSISRNSAGASASVRSRPSSGPGGRDEKGRRSIAQPATGKGRASAPAATPSAPGSAAYSHSGAVPSASPAPASAASPSSSRDDSFHPDRPARHAYRASGGRQVLGADAASAHVGAEHRADGLDQAVRIQHLRLDLVDAFVVRLQPAGVLRPFDGGEAILPGAAPVRVGQRDLARAARQS